MRAALILVCLVAAAALEALLLRLIVYHPTYGPPDEYTQNAFVQFLAWASAPLVGSGLVLAGATVLRRPLHRLVRPLIFASVVGPLLAFIAFRNPGHNAVGVLVIGFLLQCGAVLYAAFKIRSAT